MASFKGILPPVQRAATMGIMMYMGLSSNKTQEFMSVKYREITP
jgi:predicted membrane metal-binding protein